MRTMSQQTCDAMTSGIQKALLAAAFACLATVSGNIATARADAATPSVALLDVRLINDNEGLDPTSHAETERVAKLEEQVKTALTSSGKYAIVVVPPEIKAAIAQGQAIGECGGCEVEFGKKLGADRIAWVTVQKISNLILNMNFYMADVATNKMTYLKSVDIRGNTDESWQRSMKYLIDNYFLPASPNGAAEPLVR